MRVSDAAYCGSGRKVQAGPSADMSRHFHPTCSRDRARPFRPLAKNCADDSEGVQAV